MYMQQYKMNEAILSPLQPMPLRLMLNPTSVCPSECNEYIMHRDSQYIKLYITSEVKKKHGQ